MAMLPVADALARILAGVSRLGAETVPLDAAAGRTLAADLAARRDQPAVAVSSMDGYALRAADGATTLKLIGVSAAGRGFDGHVCPGETVRIFTGARLPEGADAVQMQEKTRRDGETVTLLDAVPAGRFVRAPGLDFRAGQTLLCAGTRLTPAAIALAAAMNHADVAVARAPRVVILATGDELVEPGTEPDRDQIVASNHLGVAALARAAGAQATLLPIAPDDPQKLAAALRAALARAPDVLVTIGGASVGEFDLVRDALGGVGMTLDFWRIAMRPGKPLTFGRIGETAVIGLPGNPVSALVTARLFMVPLVRAMQGDPTAGDDPSRPAILGADMPANDERQDYVRARAAWTAEGWIVTPMSGQDSSVLRALAAADALLLRAPHAPAARAGDRCRAIPL
jgi:molybdopterin molybdotransferase